jgi:hypothetical protein
MGINYSSAKQETVPHKPQLINLHGPKLVSLVIFDIYRLIIFTITITKFNIHVKNFNNVRIFFTSI